MILSKQRAEAPRIVRRRRAGCRLHAQPCALVSESKIGVSAFPAASVREREVQAGGQQNIVLLGARGRIGHVDVSERILPSQPLADLGHGAEIERASVLARVLKSGKK